MSEKEKAKHEYDRKLGTITAQDREYARDLLDDLNEVDDEPRDELIAVWFRKVRYEAVIADRSARLSREAALVERLNVLEDIASNAFAYLEDDPSFENARPGIITEL